MSNTLTLSKRSLSSTYKIVDTGLVKHNVSGSRESEFHFSFEHITPDRIYFVQDNKILLSIAAISAAIGGITLAVAITDKSEDPIPGLLLFVTAIVLFGFYLWLKERKLHLFTSDNRIIDFIFDKHRRKEIDEFVDQLMKQRNEYLLSKYTKLTKNLDYSTQLNNLNWMLKCRAISKQLYDEKIEELTQLFNAQPTSKPIGFGSNH